MRTFLKLTCAALLALGVSSVAVGVVPHESKAKAEGSAITIKDFQYAPAEMAAKVGQAITVTNSDQMPHTITANDGSFNVDVPAGGTAQVTVPKAGEFPYSCTYHPGQHNPAKIVAK
jgi:plastocyanin